MLFYDHLAKDYGELTDELRRREAAAEFAQAVIERWRPGALLDVACGTGLYTLEFARRGVPAVAGGAGAMTITSPPRCRIASAMT